MSEARIPVIDQRIPALPASHLPRRRLNRRWSECSDRKLILVTAGAGFGKTSFLAEMARADQRRCVWHLLDDRRDPPTFTRGSLRFSQHQPKRSDEERRSQQLLARLIQQLTSQTP
jgi:ATP/maltotriose-dependent transcriptional regulator MalT